MKQAIMLKPGEIEIRQTQRPEAGPGEILLKDPPYRCMRLRCARLPWQTPLYLLSCHSRP
jgi:hypothetical protein